jgi:predicted amidophosphoribosyltransferase
MVHDVTEKNEATGEESDVDPPPSVVVTRGRSLEDILLPGYVCQKCGKKYKWKGSLRNHVRLECGKEPQFHCYMCPHKTYQKGNLIRHLALFHKLNV